MEHSNKHIQSPPRQICILGGSGFIGSHLVSALARQGHVIRVLTRRRERARHLLVLPTVTLIEANIHDPAVLEQQFAQQDTVINLVGILNEQGDKGQGFQRAHVELTQKVIHACRQQGIDRLLHMSALNADAERGLSHYLRSKGQAEDLVHAATDIQVTSFRPSVIFGPGDSFFNRFAQLLKLSPYVLPLACGHSRMAPVYVGDVVQAFRHSLSDSRTWGQRYDLCGPQSCTLQALVEYTADVLGLRRKVIALGKASSWLQANLLEYAPGKPFSRDNYRSLQTDSVCQEDFPSIFALTSTSVESVVPTYLGHASSRARLSEFRRHAQRD